MSVAQGNHHISHLLSDGALSLIVNDISFLHAGTGGVCSWDI